MRSSSAHRGAGAMVLLLGACACAFQAYAQASPAREPERGKAKAPVSGSPEACGRNPAIYWAGAGPKVQVLRHGSFRQRKALEPESASTEGVAVEVRIEGKSASAYGSSFNQLRRGPASQELEQEVGDKIRWRDGSAGLPPALLILSDEDLRSSPVCGSKAVAQRPLGRASALGHLRSKLPRCRQILQQAAALPRHCLKGLYSSGEGRKCLLI
jgi:hypothetical protein